MKVLISPVGKRDPWGQRNGQRPAPLQHGAALSAALYSKPELIFLLPTVDRIGVGDEHTMAEARATAGALQELLPGVKIYTRAYDVDDPTDYAQVLPETERLLKAVMNEMPDQANTEYYINISSGTPQIQSCLQLAASAGLITAAVLQSRDPQFLKPGQEQVREVQIRYWSETLARSRAIKLFELCQFEACALEAEFLRGSPRSRRRSAAGNVVDLCKIYAALHRIDYRGARLIAEPLLKAIEGVIEYAGAGPLFKAQVQLLGRLPQVHPRQSGAQAQSGDGHLETPEFVVDLYYNAQRCYDGGAYADCLARVWRTVEGLLYLRLRSLHGIEPTDVRASREQPAAEEIVRFMGQMENKRKIEITLGSALWLFAECLKDPEYQSFISSDFPGTTTRLSKISDRVREARNQSVVGHNALPVDEQTANQGLVMARMMLASLIPDTHIDDHPFSPAAISKVGKVFFDAL